MNLIRAGNTFTSFGFRVCGLGFRVSGVGSHSEVQGKVAYRIRNGDVIKTFLAMKFTAQHVLHQ